MYAGRFAPSPTGPLHFGSLVAALGSWLDARASGGTWQVRIEDLDRARIQPGASDAILRALESLGLTWDGRVLYQSERIARYRNALERLEPHTYPCGCTRKEIADSALGLAADGAHVYPGVCRAGLPAGKPARALRVKTPDGVIEFVDRVQGPQRQCLQREVGDFVLYRADGLFAYQLAVVVDDDEQGITDVVRGADLIDSTARQMHLQRLLGLRTPSYLHLPVALNAAGQKLSKQTGAAAIDLQRGHAVLAQALAFLGQAPSTGLQQAIEQWDPARIPRRRAMPLTGRAAGSP